MSEVGLSKGSWRAQFKRILNLDWLLVEVSIKVGKIF